MVFATVALVRSWRMRTWILAILFVALALCEPFLSLFVAGILVADVFRQDGSSRSRNIAGATLCAAGLPPDLAAGIMATFEICRRARLPCRGRRDVCAGEALIREPARQFSWLDFLSALSGAGRCHLFVLGPRSRSIGFIWLGGHAPKVDCRGSYLTGCDFFFAVLFCPINDFAVRLARRFGATLFGPPAPRPLGYLGAKSRPA